MVTLQTTCRYLLSPATASSSFMSFPLLTCEIHINFPSLSITLVSCLSDFHLPVLCTTRGAEAPPFQHPLYSLVFHPLRSFHIFCHGFSTHRIAHAFFLLLFNCLGQLLSVSDSWGSIFPRYLLNLLIDQGRTWKLGRRCFSSRPNFSYHILKNSKFQGIAVGS